MSLRRSFSKYLPEEQVPALIAGYRDAGYAGLQLKGYQWAPYVGEPQRALDELGSNVGTYSALITGDAIDAEGRERIRSSIAFASAVGAERIVFCHGHPHDGVDAALRREFARTLSEIARESRDAGVAFSLHHHVGQPVEQLADFREFFDGLEPGVLGLTVDTAHLAKAGIDDLPGFIDEFGPWVDNLHLKDYDHASGEWRLFGRGDLDLVGILDALDRAGYDGWLCVDEESDATLEEGLRASREWLDANGR